MSRMARRATGTRCKSCGIEWHSIDWLTPDKAVCLICGGELVPENQGALSADVARAAVLAFNDADADRLSSLVHPDIEWRPTGVLLGEAAHPYFGRESMLTWLHDINSLWKGIRFAERELRIVDDRRVLILGALTATDRTTATTKAEPLAILFGFDDGLIRTLDEYLSWDEARTAAGLEPEDQQPHIPGFFGEPVKLPPRENR